MAQCLNRVQRNPDKAGKTAARDPRTEEMIMRLSSTANARLDGGNRATLIERFVTYVRAMRQRAQSRAAIEGLLAHDDRMLDDMGLTRQDIVNALSCSADQDPSEFLVRAKRARRLSRPMQI